MESRVGARRRAVPQTPKRPVAAIAIGIVVGVLVVLGIAFVLLRDTIERNALQARLASALGADVTIANLHHDGATTVLDDVRLRTHSGSLAFDAESVRMTPRGGGTSAALTRPRLTLAIARLGADDRFAESVASTLALGPTALRIDDGTVILRRGDALPGPTADATTDVVPYGVAPPASPEPDDTDEPTTLSPPKMYNAAATPGPDTIVDPGPPIARIAAGPNDVPDALTLDGIAGTLRLDGRTAKYALTGVVAANGKRYPLTADAPAAGGIGWRVHAAALPLQALLIGGETHLWARSGIVRYVSIAGSRGRIQGSAAVANATVVLDGRLVKNLAGPILVGRDALATSGLVGELANGTPVQFVGEVHDVTDPLHALVAGTPDLARWERIFGMTVGRRHLRSLRTEILAPGIAFAQYAVASMVGPHVIQIATVDPHEKTVRFDTAISGDHIVSHGGERTSDLGVRTGAVVGVNGDYFDIARTYEPQGLLIEHGALVRGPADRAALVIDRSGKATFAEFRLVGDARTANQTYPITQLNTWPVGEATLITPAYAPSLPPAAGVTFVALTPAGGHDRYRVASVTPATTTLPIAFGLAFGPKERRPLPNVGALVTVRYGLDPAVPNAVTGIGGGPQLLRDGEWYEDPNAPANDERDVRWPVVAVGTMRDGTVLFAAVDGRHPERSVGMARPEFAALLKTLGAVDAMALDSGGSVTMVGRVPGSATVTVVNQPSDNSAERYISDAIFAYSSAPPETLLGKASEALVPLVPDSAAAASDATVNGAPTGPEMPAPGGSAAASPGASATAYPTTSAAP
jgi:hypothetical protein